MQVGISPGITGNRRADRWDQAARDLFRAYGDWLLRGVWDDSVPTSEEWEAYANWVIDGTWDDAAPTDAATWDSPDETPYTVWDDTVTTGDAFAPNDAGLTVFNIDGVAEQSADTLRFERPIATAENYQHAAPCATVAFSTESEALGLSLYWNALITRLDTFQDTGVVLVDDAEIGTFRSGLTATETGLATYNFGLGAGTKTVKIVWPTAAGVELRQIVLDVGETPSAITPPTTKLVVCGDSITHGIPQLKSTQTWPYLLAADKGWQVFNNANGGAQANSAHATSALAGTGASHVTYMIGYNNFIAQTPTATFQATIETWIANARAALPSAQIYLITPIYSPNTNTITLADYRSAIVAAEAAAGDVNTSVIDGLTLMTNNTNRLIDGIHPNATGSQEIATALAAIL
jgi:lysophospholipase L1-like esterase